MYSAIRLTAVLVLSLLAGACGSDGQKASAPPTYNLDGTWTVAASGVQKTCPDDPTIPGQISITHDGTSNQFTVEDGGLSATPITGTIDGTTVAFAISQNALECTPLSINVYLTLSDEDHGSGTATYQCSYTSGSCGGTMNLTITRQE